MGPKTKNSAPEMPQSGWFLLILQSLFAVGINMGNSQEKIFIRCLLI